MPILYWALRTIEQTQIAGGFTIVTTTDTACHQWLRHTLVAPQKHPKPVMRRGLLIMYDARFCFVAFDDLEQNEPGDTFTHTFTWTGWENCQTRYFYFWATNLGEPMKSTSPLFSKHYYYEAPPYGPPETDRFYPTPGALGVAADGHVYRTSPTGIWSNLHDGVGTTAHDIGIYASIHLLAYGGTNLWRLLYRVPTHFDTRAIPAGSLIIEATVAIRIFMKLDTAGWKPNLALVESTDPEPGSIVPADYQNINAVPLAPVIEFDDITPEEWKEFPIASGHLDLIIPDGITKLGFRNYKHDCLDTPPPWVSGAYAGFRIRTRDYAQAAGPYLDVTWRPPV